MNTASAEAARRRCRVKPMVLPKTVDMPPRAISIIVALLLVIVAGPAVAEQIIRDEKLGFSFTLPKDFERAAAATPGSAVPLSFMRGQPGDASFAALQIVPMGGTIGPGKLHRDIVENAARESARGAGATITRFDYRQTRWKTFDLELVATFASSGKHDLLTLTTQVPVARQALQVNLVGPAQDEARLATEWNTVLTSFEGETN